MVLEGLRFLQKQFKKLVSLFYILPAASLFIYAFLLKFAYIFCLKIKTYQESQQSDIIYFINVIYSKASALCFILNLKV